MSLANSIGFRTNKSDASQGNVKEFMAFRLISVKLKPLPTLIIINSSTVSSPYRKGGCKKGRRPFPQGVIFPDAAQTVHNLRTAKKSSTFTAVRARHRSPSATLQIQLLGSSGGAEKAPRAIWK